MNHLMMDVHHQLQQHSETTYAGLQHAHSHSQQHNGGGIYSGGMPSAIQPPLPSQHCLDAAIHFDCKLDSMAALLGHQHYHSSPSSSSKSPPNHDRKQTLDDRSDAGDQSRSGVISNNGAIASSSPIKSWLF